MCLSGRQNRQDTKPAQNALDFLSFIFLETMNAFDLIILAILIGLTLRGIMKGMVKQIVSVGSYLVCWLVASRFAFLVAPSIPAEEPWNQIGAMIVLFVITMIVIRFAHALVEKWVKDLHLDKLNRLLGGTLGFAKGLLLCMVLTFFGVMLSEATRTMVFESKSGIPLSEIIARTGAFIPKDSCELLREQIDRFNTRVSGSVPESESIFSTENTPLAQLSGDENAAPAGKSVGIADFFSRSVALFDEAESLRNDLKSETRGAVSLLDGIRRWWNGVESKTNEKTGMNTTTNAGEPLKEELPAATLSAGAVFPTSAPTVFESRFATSTPTETKSTDSFKSAPSVPNPISIEKEDGVIPSVAPISSFYQDEAMIRRSAAVASNNQAGERLASLLPRQTAIDAPTPQPSVSSSSPSFLETPSTSMTSQAMSIPRSSASFRLRSRQSSQVPHADRLLESGQPARSQRAATLFRP